MKTKEIDFEFGNGEELYCPVTNQIILDDDQAYLSDASLFYYYEPDFSWQCNSTELMSKLDEFLEILNTDDSCSFDWDKEPMAIKLLLNQLEKKYTNLLLLNISVGDDSLTFCINMNYNQNRK